MGVFARRQCHGDVCGLGLCGYCGASATFASEMSNRRSVAIIGHQLPTYSRLMDRSHGSSYADQKTPGHVLAPKMLARRLVKYWIIGLSFCMIS
jgi:hypothetical protein